MATFNSTSFELGQVVQVKVNSEIVDAVYKGWHDKWNMAVVEVGGKQFYRKVHGVNGVANDGSSARSVLSQPIVKQSRFDVNTRFKFIENVVDMVVSGESKSVIISGSGGLGKTFTVMARLKHAGLIDVADWENGDAEDTQEPGGDYVVIKGFSTPKALYRLLWTHRKRIVVFDDCDSVWDNPTSVSLLKAGLDSYETRRLAWLSEIKPVDGDELPQSFEFEGKIIFVSNMSLGELDQAVLSRSLYVDVSMTAKEKIERIRAISGAIRKDMQLAHKMEALELLESKAEEIGDLNIRTYLKVLEVRHGDAGDWRDLAEYIITAL